MHTPSALPLSASSTEGVPATERRGNATNTPNAHTQCSPLVRIVNQRRPGHGEMLQRDRHTQCTHPVLSPCLRRQPKPSCPPGDVATQQTHAMQTPSALPLSASSTEAVMSAGRRGNATNTRNADTQRPPLVRVVNQHDAYTRCGRRAPSLCPRCQSKASWPRENNTTSSPGGRGPNAQRAHLPSDVCAFLPIEAAVCLGMDGWVRIAV